MAAKPIVAKPNVDCNIKRFFSQILIRDIESPSSELELRAALNTVIQLGNETSNLARISQVCNVFAVEGGVRILLRLCDLSATSVPQKAAADVRVLSLRSLGAICCVAECIRQFESVSPVDSLNRLALENMYLHVKSYLYLLSHV